MTEYIAPLADLNFVINELSKLDEIIKLPTFEHATDDLLEPILDEAARFPRLAVFQRHGIRLEDGLPAALGERARRVESDGLA